MTLIELLDELLKAQGSDLHLVTGQPPVFRIDGSLVRREAGPILDGRSLETLLTPHLKDRHREALVKGEDVELTVRLPQVRYRLHVFHERGTLAAALRRIPSTVPTLEDLGFKPDTDVIYKLTKLRRGLIIVGGPTGSGKSTMVAAMIEDINRERSERIITIEDPVEYEFESKQSLVSQRTVGEDVPNFPYGLRSAMREDPDVLLIGETRDLETMQMILALAETGHLVFSTLHINSASDAVRRIIESFPEGQQPAIRLLLANNLQAVIGQTLLPKHNKPGRVVAQEQARTVPRIRRMIAEGNYDLTVAIEAGRSIGMRTMDDDLVRLAEEGVISSAMAWSRLIDKDRVKLPEEIF